jgi:hypothetical protein
MEFQDVWQLENVSRIIMVLDAAAFAPTRMPMELELVLKSLRPCCCCIG